MSKESTANRNVRKAGADYLAYAIIDAVVDCYFPVVKQYGNRLDELDGKLSAKPGSDAIGQVHQLRSEPFALSVMSVVAVGLVGFMWRRGWLRD